MIAFALRLVLIVAIVAPVAAAHVEPRPLQQRVDHDRVLSLEIPGEFPVAGAETPLVVEILNFSTGQHPPHARLKLDAHPEGAEDQAEVVPLDELERGHFKGHHRFASKGEWRLVLRDEATGAAGRFLVRVYPEGPYRFSWSALEDPPELYAKEPGRLSFRIGDAAGAPVTNAEAGIVRVEALGPWRDVVATYEAPLRAGERPGELVLEHAFPSQGNFYIWLGVPALGLEPGDRPPFEVRVRAEALSPLGPDATRPIPLLPAWSPLCAAAAAALAWRRASTNRPYR